MEPRSEKASATAAAEYGVRWLCAEAAPAVAAAGRDSVRQRQWWWRQRATAMCGDGMRLVSRRDGKWNSHGGNKNMSKLCPDINLHNVGGTFCKFVFL